jgi:hypothetical protein
MPENPAPLPIAELAALCGWRERRVSACFDDVESDDPRRIVKGLKALAALLDGGAPEALLAAEFRRRGLGEAALEMRLRVIRARPVSKA